MLPARIFGGRICFFGDLHFASFAPTRPQHDSMMRFSVFLSFSLGTCGKNKKMTFSRGRCRKSEKSRSHAAWQSKKTNESHAAWERQKRFLRHLSSENACLSKLYCFVVVIFCEFGVVKKCLKWGCR